MYLDKENKVIGGVIAGISKQLGLNHPGILRVLVSALVIFSVGGIIPIYILMWMFLPNQPKLDNKLEQLKDLFEQGVITKEEYNQQKNEFLKDI